VSATPQSAARLAHPVIQRFFDVSLYLLLFTGFATLAGTGKLDGISLALGVSALLLKGYFLLRNNEARIPEQWTNYLTLVYVAFFALDYFLISQTFLDSLVHLILFAAMVKTFSVHRERDYVYLAILAFGMVLAAAVLTVDSLFFFIFCVFVLLAVMTFVSMEMRRSWIAAQPASPNEVRDLRDFGRLPGSVSRSCVFLVLSIVLGTVALFFLIPRKPSAGYLSALASRSELSTGFSEEVRLGEIGKIQQSSAIVMHITFAPGTKVPSDLRWRGVALTDFDGRRWTGPRGGGVTAMNQNGTISTTPNMSRLHVAKGLRISYKVSLEPFGSRVFFALPEALLISGRYQALQIDPTGSIFNTDSTQAITDYSVLSELPSRTPPAVQSAGDTGVSAITYQQKPENLDPRIAKLADQVSRNENTPFQKAIAIEKYLSTNYGYTLQQPSVPPRDPIANFLFERKQGHCEYFASAMVLMLRTIGISSRVVNGFHGGQYNDVTGSYIVRASDAHSWVEAYFSEYGWYTFDPTPSSPAAPPTWSRFYLYLDAMREFWHNWVVNYDTGRQSTLGFAAVRKSSSGIERMRDWSQSQYEGWLRRAKAARVHFQHHVNIWAAWIVAGFAVLVALLLGPRLFLAVRRLRLARKPGLEPHSAATVWYGRLLKLLSRRGIRKLPTQTPQEFANVISAEPVRRHFANFAAHYERARFGDSAEDAERLPELYRELEEITRK
jgi:hypothetical protein